MQNAYGGSRFHLVLEAEGSLEVGLVSYGRSSDMLQHYRQLQDLVGSVWFSLVRLGYPHVYIYIIAKGLPPSMNKAIVENINEREDSNMMNHRAKRWNRLETMHVCSRR